MPNPQGLIRVTAAEKCGSAAHGEKEVGGFEENISADEREAGDEAGVQIDPEQHEKRKEPKAEVRAAVVMPEQREKSGEEDGGEEIGAWYGAEGDSGYSEECEGGGKLATAPQTEGDSGGASDRAEPGNGGVAGELMEQIESDAGEWRIDPGCG